MRYEEIFATRFWKENMILRYKRIFAITNNCCVIMLVEVPRKSVFTSLHNLLTGGEVILKTKGFMFHENGSQAEKRNPITHPCIYT